MCACSTFINIKCFKVYLSESIIISHYTFVTLKTFNHSIAKSNQVKFCLYTRIPSLKRIIRKKHNY